jgi:CBS domain-containing protein
MANFEVAASEYMSAPVKTLRGSSFIDHAHRQLQQLRVSALPVVDDEDVVVGVISRTDVLKVGRREANSRPASSLLDFPAKPVSEFMTPNPGPVPPDTPLSKVAQLMVSGRVHRILLGDEGRVEGIITTRDLMQAIREKQVRTPISEYMSSPLFTIRASEPVAMATQRLEKAKITGLVVVDGDWPVGVFTQVEALESRDLPRDTAVEEVMNPGILVLDEATPVFRAAAQAAVMQARRVVVTVDGKPEGIVTGLDFARIVA